MANGSRDAQISGGKAAFLWQRVEDNAFHLQQHVCAPQPNICVICAIRGFLNVFVFIRVYSPGRRSLARRQVV
jgi:hypothetical protein